MNPRSLVFYFLIYSLILGGSLTASEKSAPEWCITGLNLVKWRPKLKAEERKQLKTWFTAVKRGQWWGVKLGKFVDQGVVFSKAQIEFLLDLKLDSAVMATLASNGLIPEKRFIDRTKALMKEELARKMISGQLDQYLLINFERFPPWIEEYKGNRDPWLDHWARWHEPLPGNGDSGYSLSDSNSKLGKLLRKSIQEIPLSETSLKAMPEFEVGRRMHFFFRAEDWLDLAYMALEEFKPNLALEFLKEYQAFFRSRGEKVPSFPQDLTKELRKWFRKRLKQIMDEKEISRKKDPSLLSEQDWIQYTDLNFSWISLLYDDEGGAEDIGVLDQFRKYLHPERSMNEAQNLDLTLQRMQRRINENRRKKPN